MHVWRWIFIALCVAAPLGAGLFRVWVHQDAVIMGYRLSEETRQRDRLREAIAKHRVELAAEQTPAALKRWAKELGLAPARPDQTLSLGIAPVAAVQPDSLTTAALGSEMAH